MSHNLLVESLYPPLVTRHIGAAHHETDRLCTCFDAAAVHGPAAGGSPPASDAMTSTLITLCLGARAPHPQFDRALDALIDGDTLVITSLDRLGRSTQNMLAFADELRDRGAGLRVLNLGGGDVDTVTPMGSMLFTIMAALAQMEHKIKRERVTDSISKRREAGRGPWRPTPPGH